MRLAQLARKISVKPSEITEFLATRDIQLENSSNAKVMDEHVALVLTHFAPEMMHKDDVALPEALISEQETSSGVDAEEFSQKVEEAETTNDVVTPDDAVETPEVIKPVKVELPGLKVVGKIDLPEPKKKEEKLADDSDSQVKKEEGGAEAAQPDPRSSGNRRVARPRREHDRRPRKNPIALQREREEREALRRKLAQQEKDKELRTKRYLKKVKAKTSPPKPIKKMSNDEEYETYSEATTKPKSFIGKIINWFVSE